MQNTNDDLIAVIGAGSTGASTAYHLAKSGRRVVLIDKSQIASGMTSRSSAIVRTHYSNEMVARMALYSMHVFKSFHEIGNSGFVQSGMIILVPSELRKGTMENVAMLNKIGALNEVLDPLEAKKKFPEIDYEGIDFVDYEPESGYADSVSVANSYARAAEKLGVELRLGAQVKKLEVQNGRVTSVILEDGYHIHSSKVVLCTNIWTHKLLRASGLDDLSENTFPLWAATHPVVVLKRPRELEGIKSIVWDYQTKIYSKPEGQSLCFVGSLDPSYDQIRADPDTFANEVGFELVDSYVQALSQRIPAMKDGSYHSSYVGAYDLTPDQHPIIDELSALSLKGVYCCVGLSGHGFKLCPALGLITSQMVLGEEHPTFDRTLFSLDRFKTGKLISSKHASLATVA